MSAILDFACDTLLMERLELMTFASTAPHRYKKYYIKKRSSNEFRLIAQPSKETKFIQRVVLNKIRELLPVHRCAMAYEKGVGIKLNALHHKDNSYLLKMDFRDFFPSITPALFFLAAKNCGLTFSEVDTDFLSKILFFKSTRKSNLRLSIGAPSSPFISNFIMFKFDSLMSEYCVENKINYTRYADDLTFSTNVKGVLFSIPVLVRTKLKIASQNTIKVNELKTVFSSMAFNRHVTGIVINNNSELSLGRKKKRLYSSMIHRYLNGLLDNESKLRLKGLLAHCIHIEPDFIEIMKAKYSAELIDALMKE